MGSRNTAPLYVRAGLFGIGSRAAAIAFVWLSVFAAIGLSLYFATPLGLVFLLAALWYWLAIKWMDENGAWANA